MDTSINNIESPEDQVAFLSSLGYHVKDVYELIEESTKDKLSSNEKTRVDKFFQWKNEDIPDNEYKGIFEGKNVLFLQIESLESVLRLVQALALAMVLCVVRLLIYLMTVTEYLNLSVRAVFTRTLISLVRCLYHHISTKS